MTPSATNGTVSKRRKRLLLVTYPFPPVGGAGVQRVTKFVKYLPSKGWNVSVLTVANPSVPLFDDSLASDIPGDTRIYRAKSWEPGYGLKASVSANKEERNGGRFNRIKTMVAGTARRLASLVLQPDPQVLWMPGAVDTGKKLLRRLQHDAILASGPPFSTFLIGASLARYSRLPLVLDYRDEWTISNEYWENKRFDVVSRCIQDRMQRRVVRAASGIIATTRSSAGSLETLKRKSGGKAQVTCVYNGFDPDDFEEDSVESRSDGDRFRLAYIGTLWNLTSVRPLLEAVRQIARDNPAVAARLDLVFAGRRTGVQAQLVDEFRELPCRLTEYSYLEHLAAVRLMRGSEALCLLLSDLPGAGRVVPAKLFEYVATGRPILTIAPPGEARSLLVGYPGGQFAPADVSAIAGWLTNAILEERPSKDRQTATWDSSAFTRENETAQLAEFLDQFAPAH
jgi:glycosyltransferase involved in cell wall biosynthesis